MTHCPQSSMKTILVIAKRAKVMFLHDFCHSVTEWGEVTPDASWDRSHGHRGGGQPGAGKCDNTHPHWTGSQSPTTPSLDRITPTIPHQSPRQDHTHPSRQDDTPQTGHIWALRSMHMCRQYASYWNAFLFLNFCKNVRGMTI